MCSVCVCESGCKSQWRAIGTVTRVTVRRGPPPWLPVATDGSTTVFRRLSSPSLSYAHTYKHILRPWWDTISTLPHSLFLCLPPTHSHTHTDTHRHAHSRHPPSLPPQVCVYVCAAIISNHVSVLSLGVCELPPPGWPICAVVAVMVMASKLSLSSLSPPLPRCPLFTC